MADALRNQRLLAATQKRTTDSRLRGDRGYESLSDADVSSSSNEGDSEEEDSRSDLLDMVGDDCVQTPTSPSCIPTPLGQQRLPGLPLPNSNMQSMNSSMSLAPQLYGTLPPNLQDGRSATATPQAGTPRVAAIAATSTSSNSFMRAGRPQHIMGLSQIGGVGGGGGMGTRGSSSIASPTNNYGTPTSQSGRSSPSLLQQQQRVPVQRQFDSDDDVPMSSPRRAVIPVNAEPTPMYKPGVLALRSNTMAPLRPLQPTALTLTSTRIFNHRTCNLLVIGGTQVGKSSFINSYRAAVTHNEKWPMAPVGICGRYGTAVVDPCPNHTTAPTWLLIDTPGKTYSNIEDDDSDDAIILGRLFEGVEWKTKLLGKGSISISALSQQDPIPHHRAHQCMVVVNVCDLVTDKGRLQALRWSNRYEPAPQARFVVPYLQELLHRVRELQEDTPPFVIVTQMDKMGGVACAGAREAALVSLRKCASVNSIYFVACPSFDAGPRERENPIAYTTDVDTRSEILRLHQDVMSSVSWSICQKPDLLQEMLESNTQR